MYDGIAAFTQQFKNVCVCRGKYVNEDAFREQTRVSEDPFQVELQVVISCPMGMVGTKLGTIMVDTILLSIRTVHSLNH